MMIICDATQFPDMNVQVAAFQCLVRVMSLYYDHMLVYMQQALFEVLMIESWLLKLIILADCQRNET